MYKFLYEIYDVYLVYIVFVCLCNYVSMWIYVFMYVCICTMKICYNYKYKSWYTNKRDVKISVLQDP